MLDSILFLVCILGVLLTVFSDFRSHGVTNRGKPFWLFVPPPEKQKSEEELKPKRKGRRQRGRRR